MGRNYESHVNQSGSDVDVDVIMPGIWTLPETSINCTTVEWASTTPDEMGSNGSLPRDGFFFGELYLHPHWLQYRDVIDEAPAWFLYLLGVYMTVVCITGIAGNITVITVFLRTTALRTPSNFFIINLAFNDTAFSIINGFPLMSFACFNRKWMWGQTVCEWYGFLGGVLGLNSIGSLTLIAIDRYFSISRPFETLYKATSKRALVGTMFIWIWSLIWTCPPLIGWGRYIAEGFQVSCSFDYLSRSPANIVYNYCLLGFGFLLPVAIISGCYVGIVRCVSRQSAELMSIAESVFINRGKDNLQETEDQARQDQEIRQAKIVAIMVSLFVLSWLPYALITQFGINGLDVLVTPYSTEIPIMLAKASAIWNPIVYAFTNPHYKVALLKISPCCKIFLRTPETSGSISRRPSSVRRQLCQSMTATSPQIEIICLEN